MIIGSVSACLCNNARLSSNREHSLATSFCGAKKDVFVSTIPKIAKLSKNKVDEICSIYLRYRESANVKSSVGEVKKYLQTELKKGDDSILVAKIGDQTVGFLHYVTERSTLRPAERIRLKAMFVDEDYRGRGISKQLLASVQEEAGGKEIVVKAKRSNKVSSSLYMNNGFKEDEEYFHLVYKK